MSQIKATCTAKLGSIPGLPHHFKAKFLKRCIKKLTKRTMFANLKKMPASEQKKVLEKLRAEKKRNREQRRANRMKALKEKRAAMEKYIAQHGAP